MVLERPFFQETKLWLTTKDGLQNPFISDTGKTLLCTFIAQVSWEIELKLKQKFYWEDGIEIAVLPGGSFKLIWKVVFKRQFIGYIGKTLLCILIVQVSWKTELVKSIW